MRVETALLWMVILGSLAAPARAEEIRVSTAGELETVFSSPQYDVTVRLVPGAYHLTPSAMVDSLCGNCEDPERDVDVTVGLRVGGRGIRIVGGGAEETVLYTHAGYGVFFEDCEECFIGGVSISGGERDPDPNATDGAIVVRNSTLRIEETRITDNIGDSTTVAGTVVGIIGVCGRENSVIDIVDNQIIRNSWDGIALYRGAEAVILRNVIDGVDKARGKQVGGGRGVAIGVTWNAKARIEENLVRRYWKGIGLFVDAQGIVRYNIVEDILTWGIALWDADKGHPAGTIERNVVYDTGACGVSITCSETAGGVSLAENIIVHTAQNPKYDAPDYYCYQCAVALHAVPEGARIEGNVLYDNRRATEDLPDDDVGRDEFVLTLGDRRYERLWDHPLFAPDSETGSAFRRRFLREIESTLH